MNAFWVRHLELDEKSMAAPVPRTSPLYSAAYLPYILLYFYHLKGPTLPSVEYSTGTLLDNPSYCYYLYFTLTNFV